MGVLPFITEDASSAGLAFHERPIDLVHLARTTLGDPSLEGEMLEAFGLKASMLILRMQQAGKFETSGFISHRTKLTEINDAIGKMRSGEAIHTLIVWEVN